MLLDPTEEEAFIQNNKKTQEKKLKANLQKKSINPTKTMLVSQRASSLVAEHVTLYALAKKAFWSYVRSLSLMPKDGIWSDINVRDFHLEEYAHSLGLPKIPGDLDKVLKNVSSREGLRESKNVNRKLQKLKEQIRLDKEEKKRKRKRQTENEQPEVDKKEEDEEEGNGLLVVKAVHKATHADPGIIPLSSTKLRKPKRIRIDGGNSDLNKHVVFEDDGTERPTIFEMNKDTIDNIEDSSDDDDSKVAEALRDANDDYVEQVRQRLENTKELDKQEERERVRTKHKNKRMKEKHDRSEKEDGDSGQLVELATADDRDGSSSCSSSNSDESSSDDGDSSGLSDVNDDDDDNSSIDHMNIAEQENLALSLIRGIS